MFVDTHICLFEICINLGFGLLLYIFYDIFHCMCFVCLFQLLRFFLMWAFYYGSTYFMYDVYSCELGAV